MAIDHAHSMAWPRSGIYKEGTELSPVECRHLVMSGSNSDHVNMYMCLRYLIHVTLPRRL